MDLSNILNNNVKISRRNQTNPANISFERAHLNWLVKKPMNTDSVSFGSIDPAQTAETKMLTCIDNMLRNELKLQPDQPLHLKVDKEFIPFAKLLVREAYKLGSGNISIDTVEPELEKLKTKYNIGDFDWKKTRDDQIRSLNGIFLELNAAASPYSKAKLTSREIEAVKDNEWIKIPAETQEKLKIIPSEIVDAKLNLRKGQPIRIIAEREHEPNVLRLVEYAYKKGSGPIDVTYSEPGVNSFDRTCYEFASEKVLKNVPEWVTTKFREYLDKNAALIYLDGEDPKGMEGVDPDRMTMKDVAYGKAIKFYKDSMTRPWTIYYAPTTKSAISAYPEYQKGATATRDEELDALRHAAIDAVKINRVGKTKEHVQNLERVAKILNSSNFKQIHFISTETDPDTGKPKTDLYIGLNDLGKFMAAESKTAKYKQRYVANCPTEEVFSTPNKNLTRGYVEATMPLSINGNIVDGIRMVFDDEGKVSKFSATKNEDVFKKHIEKHKDADMLGEVALVAGSPIFDLGRIFNSTLLDENAACHIAIGSGYGECIKGAEDITDPDKLKAFLAENNVNDSTTHVDFMIGGPKVIVEGIKEDGSKVTLIKDNKFQI